MTKEEIHKTLRKLGPKKAEDFIDTVTQCCPSDFGLVNKKGFCDGTDIEQCLKCWYKATKPED